jgi:hypothetical protein
MKHKLIIIGGKVWHCATKPKKKAVKAYLKIGNYTPATEDTEAVIERDYSEQGCIFKDEEAFENHTDKACYIPELSDTVYTRQAFLDLCGGNASLARECFEVVDWQHPETWVEEQFQHGEWDACDECGWVFSIYHNADEPEISECPHCGAKYPSEDK